MKKRTKVGSAYSKWLKIRHGIPKGSILGLLLFNIFISDKFMIIKLSDICKFADDNTHVEKEIEENLFFDTKKYFKLV